MSDDKPTKQEIMDLKSRLIFLRDKSNILSSFTILIYLIATILGVYFKLGEYLAIILALGLFNSIAFIDKANDFKNEYNALNIKTTTDKRR